MLAKGGGSHVNTTDNIVAGIVDWIVMWLGEWSGRTAYRSKLTTASTFVGNLDSFDDGRG